MLEFYAKHYRALSLIFYSCSVVLAYVALSVASAAVEIAAVMMDPQDPQALPVAVLQVGEIGDIVPFKSTLLVWS